MNKERCGGAAGKKKGMRDTARRAGLVLGVVVAGAILARLPGTRIASAQDLTSDLAVFLRGTVPQVAVTVDGAATFAVTARMPWAFVSLACTGAEAIDTITGGREGLLLFIEHTDTDCTLNDDESATAADAMDLTGAANDVGAVGKVIVLISNGDNWLEVAESDN